MGRTYIEKLQPNSTMDTCFNKSTQDQLRGSFITHINNTPVFDTKDAERILQDLYTQYLQEQGVATDNDNNKSTSSKSKSKSRSKSKTNKQSNFEFQITFVPERKLQGAKLKKAMDDFYGYAPCTTKTIKSKPETLPDMKDVDDGSERYGHGTIVYKVFNDIEYKGTVQGYDPHRKLYFIVYEDGDKEDYYHNEVKAYCEDNVKRHPRRKRWNNRKSVVLTNPMHKYAPTEADSDEHVPTLSVEDIRAITSIRFTDRDKSEDAIPTEMIKVCINTLNSDFMTPEEQALGYFTRKKLKRLSTWDEWLAGEAKQLNQFYDQKIIGDPIDADTLDGSAVVL